MMADNYLTIKEFAAAAGVSQQAVYKRLEKALKPYYKIIDGKKMIAKEGLEIYLHSTIQPTIQPAVVNPVENAEVRTSSPENGNQINSTSQSTSLTTENAQFEALNKTLEILQRELEVKNKQIDDLNNRLAEALKTVETQNILISQQQHLSLLDKTESKAEITTEQGEEITQVGASLDRRNAVPIEPEEKKSEAQKEKKSFWQRLFGI